MINSNNIGEAIENWKTAYLAAGALADLTAETRNDCLNRAATMLVQDSSWSTDPLQYILEEIDAIQMAAKRRAA